MRTAARILIPLIVIVAVVGALVAIKFKQISSLIAFGAEMEKAGAPPETIGTSKVARARWEGTLTAVGSVTAARGVTVANDAPGVVTRIHFDSGDVVKVGQVLVELDSSVEQAQLASAVSRLDLANRNAKRSRMLGDKGALPAAEVENDESVARTATTELETLRAQIARKIVRAPFAGKLGIREVNVGQYLQPGTRLTVLESGRGLHVDFTLPQQRLSDLKVGMPVRVTLTGSTESAMGELSAIDPQIDAVSRTIKLRATLPGDKLSAGPDPDPKPATPGAEPSKGATAATSASSVPPTVPASTGTETSELRAGMFVNVAVILPEQAEQLVVPLTSVVRAAYGNSIFVVEGESARQQFVKLGPSRGDFVAVLDGLKDTDVVVSAGAFKLRNGSKVLVNNDVGAKPQQDPRPENR